MSTDNQELDKILAGHSPKVISLVAELRSLVQYAAPTLSEEVKTGWGNITYSGKGIVCAISPHKAFVNLHFYKGTRLEDPTAILQGSGKKLRHVKIRGPEEIKPQIITQLVQQAVKIDAE